MHAASVRRLLLPVASFSGSPVHWRAPPPFALLDGPTELIAGATSAVASADASLKYFAAGGLCAAISHSIATPIDVVKTRKQTVAEYEALSLPAGLARVVRDQGVGALFTGLGPTAIGYGLEGALKFGSYEAIKAPITTMLHTLRVDSSSTLGPVLAAIVAGGLASLVLAPTEATRIRLVSDASFADERSALSAAQRILQEEGAAGLLRGVPATFSKQMPYTATKQVTFDVLTASLAASGANGPLNTVAAASTAAILSTLASQPGDAILSEVSKAGGGATAGESDRSIGAVVQRLGGTGLVRGLRARLVHVGVVVTVQLVLYDTLKHAFGVP